MVKKFIPLTLLLTACSMIPSVGPDYERPEDPKVEKWESTNNHEGLFGTAADATSKWWAQLEDPILNSLIEKAVKNNPSYEIAASRLQEARGQTRIAFSSFLPTINASYNAKRTSLSRQSQSSIVTGGTTTDTTATGTTTTGATTGVVGRTGTINTYQAGLDAFWEIDIFGGNRRAFEAANADEDAIAAQFDSAGISLAAEVAMTYVELRSFQKGWGLLNITLNFKPTPKRS